MDWTCRTPRVLPFAALAAVLLSAAVAPAAAAAAPEPFVFANLTTSGREAGSDPYAVAACADAVVFSAAADGYGRELWRTDGTPRGTFLLADLCLGRCSATLSGFGLKTGPDLSFLEVDLGAVQELWRTDCTEAGTFRLGALPGRYVTSTWLPGRHRMVFRGSDGAGGSEPWVTDGTRAGTRRLADIVPGAGGSDPDTFRAVGDLAWFTARDLQHGRELWRSDGTPAGTVRVSDLVPGPGDGAARVLGAAGQTIVFEGIDAASGLEPWSAAAGAVPRRLGDLTPGAGGSRIGTWNEDGRRLLFHIRQDEEPQTEVWATDGTPAGTHRLLEANPTFLLYTVAAVGTRTLFVHHDLDHGRELWSTDGTPAGTRLVVDLCPGFCSGVGNGFFFPFAGAWYFSGSKDGQDRELWRTDGSAAGTVRVADLCPGACSSDPFGPDERGLVVTRRGSGHETLWHTDGTAAGSAAIADFDRVLWGGGIFGPGDSTAAGTLLSADDGVVGDEPWWTDGTAAGTVRLGDLLRGTEDGSNPRELTRVGDRFVFSAGDATGQIRLWVSDGTPAATRLVPAIPGLAVLDGRELRIAAGAGGAFVLIGGVDEYGNRTGEATLYWTDGDLPPRELAVVPLGPGIEYAVFVGDGRGAFLLGPELWYSDGTVAGTRQLRSFAQQGFAAAGLLLGGKLHFVSRQDGAFPSLSLAVSDGTAGGTQDYYEDPRWSAGGGPISLVSDDGGGYYFIASHGDDAGRIWHSDGTGAGTRVAVDLAELQQPRFLTRVDETLFFLAPGSEGETLWASDGTSAGTVDLMAPAPTRGYEPSSLAAVALDGELIYVSYDRNQPRFWRSDGTRAGTVPIPDLAPPDGGTDLVAAYPWTAGGHVFVTAQYAGEPWKLWLRESPAAPSVLLGEFPTAGYSPGEFLSLGSRVYFAADDERIGRELWAVDFAAPPPVAGCVADAEHLCLADGRFRLRADWRDPRTGSSGVAGALPFPGSERTGLFWFFNPANVELIVKMLDGSGVNGFFWTFYGALTDVEYWIDVEDRVTGARRTYHNPPREICGRADTTTFDSRPAAGPAAGASVAAAAADTVCATGPDALCLLDRFRVEVEWRNQRTGHGGVGTAIPGTDRSGYFWFFRDDNVELVVKVLDGRPVNGRFWVFYGALTDVEYTITVTDTATADVATYHNLPGEICGDADTTAF